jgi:hypothetical protein
MPPTAFPERRQNRSGPSLRIASRGLDGTQNIPPSSRQVTGLNTHSERKIVGQVRVSFHQSGVPRRRSGAAHRSESAAFSGGFSSRRVAGIRVRDVP